MRAFRVALAQADFTVGDLDGNARIVREWTGRAVAAGADLVAFPEMCLTGYPVEDLAFRPTFVAANRAVLADLAAGSGETAMIVGHLDDDRGPRNAATLLWRGAARATYYKHHLPNYGVFDEPRWFRPGDRLPVVTLQGVRIALTICEDLWQDGGPVAAAGRAGADLVVVVNGSPYERGKAEQRLALVQRRAREAGATFAYVNTVGAQDDLVFDGDSVVVAPDGSVLARAARFEEELLVVDLDLARLRGAVPAFGNGATADAITVDRIELSPGPPPDREPVPARVAPVLDDDAEVYGAVVIGTRDYIRKNGFGSVVLGLSGGIDSSLVATIAVDAIGAGNVHTVAMPSAVSSAHSVEDAAELARRQGTQHVVVPIQPVADAFHTALAHTGGLAGLAAENLQARVRGTLLMALSNQHGHLVLTTGNKSELATGYSTLYGDSAGGWAPIKDIPKTLVWRLARWRNALARDRGETEPIPERSITKPPSAELAPGQLDSDRLPPYELLDRVLELYVEQDVGRDGLVANGFDEELVDHVITLVDLAEYKRRQYPPGPKLTPRAFGRDRRLPMTNRWRERTPLRR